ncbi:hypothetical protein EG856_02465 [Mycoplasmopsis phocirhinis]|uniref:Cupin n=1 Tax=Mycoplasmopsis phocirhinis TaxID=142650 RepID=A0A4P6MRS8_9BACT|nr:hypothetical protein [Mycoplasmopsis phocirhinis]QBF34769.1 hypothetical protein EG856_02465 [Mycoplasmopsis phocirhinis]
MINDIEIIKNLFLDQNEIKKLNSSYQGRELFEPIFNKNQQKIEVIHSFNAQTDWIINNTIEFVILLKGSGTLQNAQNNFYKINQGNLIKINPFTKHKVVQTSKYALWLAIHLGGDDVKS